LEVGGVHNFLVGDGGMVVHNGCLVKNLVEKVIVKTIYKNGKKYDMYNNIALGKANQGLKVFGDDVGANVWTNETHSAFTTFYDLPDSWSFERSLTSALNQTIGDLNGKILFDVTNVDVSSAVMGGLVHNFELIRRGLITELELQMVLRNSSWFNNTTFHKGGISLTIEELNAFNLKIIP
jgi:hypothetical protein